MNGSIGLLCSQNAHDQNVLAWDKSASWRARGWAGEMLRAVEGRPIRSSSSPEPGD